MIDRPYRWAAAIREPSTNDRTGSLSRPDDSFIRWNLNWCSSLSSQRGESINQILIDDTCISNVNRRVS